MKKFKFIVIPLMVAGLFFGNCTQKEEEFDLFELLLLWFILNQSCSITSPAASSAFTASSDVLSQDQLFIHSDAEMKKGLFKGPAGFQEHYYHEHDGKYVVEGDMIFNEVYPLDYLDKHPELAPQAENSTNSIVTSSSSSRWTNKVVYYNISTASTNMVEQAIRHWEAQSTFRFVNSTSSHYINFKNDGVGNGCSSYVGNIGGGSQDIQVEDACGTGSTVHEIGHALGIYHEQSRNDRDSNVIVYTDRIQSGKAGNYAIATSGTDSGPYDFNSIMHYGSYYFASGSDPVMTKHDGSIISANRSALTTCDVNGITQAHDNTN